MFFRKKSVIDWFYFAALVRLDVLAFQNPFSSQWRQALNWVKRHAWIAPRTAGVVNADRLVYFDLARHRFGRSEGYFAARDANIGMQLAGDENLF